MNESESQGVHKVTDTDSVAPATEDETSTKLSKRQIKKQQKKEHWEAVKAEKRAEERQKRKDRRRKLVEQGLPLPPGRKRLKKNKMSESSCKQKVAIDCSFDDLMADKDISNMVRQINHCYAANRRAEHPLQFYVTTVEKKTKERLESLEDFKHWDINFTKQSYVDEFGLENVVYLSSESPNVLNALDESKTYIIGGLVDHNHHKGLCLQLADEKKVAHAQLPISQYMDMKTRKVLSINQVFEILLHFTETADWKEAFCRAIPSRKGAATKADQTANVDRIDSQINRNGTNVSDSSSVNNSHMSRSGTKASDSSAANDNQISRNSTDGSDSSTANSLDARDASGGDVCTDDVRRPAADVVVTTSCNDDSVRQERTAGSNSVAYTHDTSLT